MRLKITEVQIVPIRPSNGLVGFASFILNDSFYLGSIGIYTRPEGGYRLTYPTRKTISNDFNIFRPINKEVSEAVEQAIISKFENVTKSYGGHNQINFG